MPEEGYPCQVVTWHPCDYLIEQVLKAVACCLGLCDSFSFCQPRETNDQQDQEQGDGETDQPAAGNGGDPPTAMAAARRRPRQPPPSEGRGGQHT